MCVHIFIFISIQIYKAPISLKLFSGTSAQCQVLLSCISQSPSPTSRKYVNCSIGRHPRAHQRIHCHFAPVKPSHAPRFTVHVFSFWASLVRRRRAPLVWMVRSKRVMFPVCSAGLFHLPFLFLTFTTSHPFTRCSQITSSQFGWFLFRLPSSDVRPGVEERSTRT